MKNRIRHRAKVALREVGWELRRASQISDYLDRRYSGERVMREFIHSDSWATNLDLLTFIQSHKDNTFARNYEDLFALWALRDSTAPFYIDVGAWDPVYLNNTYLLELQGWPGLLVEPSSERASQIREKRVSRLIQAALVLAEDETETRVLADAGSSSAALKHAGPGVTGEKVDLISAKAISRLVPESLDVFLSIDVEGGEAGLIGELMQQCELAAICVEALSPDAMISIRALLFRLGFSQLLPSLTGLNGWFISDQFLLDGDA